MKPYARSSLLRQTTSALLSWLMVYLMLVTCPAPVRSQLKVTITPLDADGDYRISEGTNLFVLMTLKMRKVGPNVEGGGFHLNFASRPGHSGGFFCFKGVVSGNRIYFTRVVENGPEYISHIDDLPGVEIKSGTVSRMGADELIDPQQYYARCRETNELFDSLQKAAEDVDDTAAVLKGVQVASDVGTEVLGATREALRDYRSLRKEAVENIVFKIKNAKIREEFDAAMDEYRVLAQKLKLPESVKRDGFAQGIIRAIENDPKATLMSALDFEAGRQFNQRFAELSELRKTPVTRAILLRAVRAIDELNQVDATYSTALKVLKKVDGALRVARWALSDNYLKTAVEEIIGIPATAAALSIGRFLARPLVCLIPGVGGAVVSTIILLTVALLAAELTEEFVDALDLPQVESFHFYDLFVHREPPGLEGNKR